MYTQAEYLAALEKVRAEFDARTGGSSKMMTFQETNDFRRFAMSQTNLHSGDLTAEQAAWKTLYHALTDELRKTDPETMAKVESLEAEMEALEAVRDAVKEKIQAHPHDYGFRVPLGFLIVGVLIGWFREGTVWSILVCAFASWVAGMLFSIFVTRSAYVQSVVAIKLNRIGFNRIAHWLYNRSLTIT
jgi:hypothetical protein